MARANKPRRKRSRKRRHRAAQDTGASVQQAYRARSQARNEQARAALEPLAAGERPGAVTVAAVVAALLAVANLAAYAAGMEIRGDRPHAVGVAAYSGVMLVAAWGMWRVKYWAVLGMQALLGLLIVILSLVLFTSASPAGAAVLVALIVPAGALFWLLVKAMARIQMPARQR